MCKPARLTIQDSRILDEITARISEMLARTPAKDLEKILRASLSGVFSQPDLVTARGWPQSGRAVRVSKKAAKRSRT